MKNTAITSETKSYYSTNTSYLTKCIRQEILKFLTDDEIVAEVKPSKKCNGSCDLQCQCSMCKCCSICRKKCPCQERFRRLRNFKISCRMHFSSLLRINCATSFSVDNSIFGVLMCTFMVHFK
jgi:hypothetical protein